MPSEHPSHRAFAGLTRMVIRLAFAIASLDALAHNLPEKLVFGGDANYPPFEWIERGAPTGFNVDLANAIVTSGKIEIEHRLGQWPDTVSALESGEVDVVPMFVSGEREKAFLFTSPFYYVNHSIYALDDTYPIYSTADLINKRVAVEELSFAHQQLSVEGIEVTLVLTTNTLEALNAIKTGTADYAILAIPPAERLIQSHAPLVKRLGPPFWPRGYAFAVRKDREDLRNWLQWSLDSAISSGLYQEVDEKWRPQLSPGKEDHSKAVRILAFAGALLTLMITLAVTWSWSLRHKVQARTSELQSALTRAQTAEAHARYLAEYDEDTGLAKPYLFANLVDHLLDKQSSEKELLFLKLVGLNEVIDALGLGYSKQLIRNFADEMNNLAQAPCGYFGQGIFAAFSDKQKIRNLYDAICFQGNTAPHYSYIAGGSAYYPEHGSASSELITHAQTALANALSNQLRWSVYDASMEPDPHDLEIISAFRKNKLDGLYSVFQPQINLGTGEITGAEALIRWNHPTLGKVGPDKFIPLIEKAGLLPRITAVMLDDAVRVGSYLRRLKHPIIMSVNIAICDLTQTDFPAIVMQAIRRHNGCPQDLKLELTETSFSSDSRRIQEALEKLNELGVWISIDDFGTGYSSLAYLSVFPVHELKIDRTFVTDMVSNAKNRSLVRSTILMADQLGLKTVAEGAEDHATLRLLKDDGCTSAQGYAISKPLPEAEFLTFIEGYSAREQPF